MLLNWAVFLLSLQSGAAGHSQHDAVLQALDVGVHHTDTHGVAGPEAAGEVQPHLLVFLCISEVFVSHQSSGLSFLCKTGCVHFPCS